MGVDHRRVKVLRIIARLNVGGPAIQACALTSRLDPDRYETRLVAGAEADGERSFLELHGLTVQNLIRVPSLGRELSPIGDLHTVATLVRLMRRERPDVVHTHTAKAGAVGRLAARLAGVPVIVHTFHGHVLDGYFSPLKTRIFTGIERQLARRSSELIAVTPTVRSQLLQKGIGDPDHFSVVRLGLDLEPFLDSRQRAGKLRRELGVALDVPLVGIVGRLVPIKAHHVFLDAAAHVAAATPAEFVIVGDGELRAKIEAQVAALGLTQRVHFLGWRADLPAIYADLDVVALSSLNEGSPVALIEAMAAGRAVVSTRVGGVGDVIEDGRTGLLVPSGDVTALAAAIKALVDDPTRRQRLGVAARSSVYPTYRMARLVKDIDDLYCRLIEHRTS
jgi:glycosyltransferase involved in cell wall biosynthesis